MTQLQKCRENKHNSKTRAAKILWLEGWTVEEISVTINKGMIWVKHIVASKK